MSLKIFRATEETCNLSKHGSWYISPSLNFTRVSRLQCHTPSFTSGNTYQILFLCSNFLFTANSSIRHISGYHLTVVCITRIYNLQHLVHNFQHDTSAHFLRTILSVEIQNLSVVIYLMNTKTSHFFMSGTYITLLSVLKLALSKVFLFAAVCIVYKNVQIFMHITTCVQPPSQLIHTDSENSQIKQVPVCDPILSCGCFRKV